MSEQIHRNAPSAFCTVLAVAGVLVFLSLLGRPTDIAQAAPPTSEGKDFTIWLKSRQFQPAPGVEPAVQAVRQAIQPDSRFHALVQFDSPPDAAVRAELERQGVTLLAYVPENAWFASLPAALTLSGSANGTSIPGVRWVGEIQSADRLHSELNAGQVAANEDGLLGLDVLFFADVSEEAARQVLQQYGAIITGKAFDFHRFTVRLDPAQLDALAAEDTVQWIAPEPPPPVAHNDGSRARTGVDIVQSAPYGLDGSGVTAAMWDGGPVGAHDDFGDRVTIVENDWSTDSHSTHVAGTMAGDGYRSAASGGTPHKWRGMATNARILSYDFEGQPTIEHQDAVNRGADLSQNSWGTKPSEDEGDCSRYGDYEAMEAEYDAIVAGQYGRRIPIIFSAGNERDNGDCGMSHEPPYLNYGVVPPHSTAKNVVAVGATNSNDDSMTDFSNWGPVDDGRLKPDVVAPGCQIGGDEGIYSTVPDNAYGSDCGTSMAAPAVSGISALLIQQFRMNYGLTPLPSTVKAALIHSAQDLSDAASYYKPGPDYASGYGRVDAKAAIDLVAANQIREGEVNGEIDSYTLEVPAGTPVLKVTLAWDDAPGTPNAAHALVNNLDLALVEPGGLILHRPWVLNPANPAANATTGVDDLNNAEQVYVANPAAGVWTVRVLSTNVPVGPQPYSLVLPDPDFALLASAQLNACGPQVEYRLDVLSILGFSEPVTLSAQSAPAGLTFSFANNPLQPSGSTTMTVGNALEGEYDITVVGQAASTVHTTTIHLRSQTLTVSTPTLLSPPDGELYAGANPTLDWTEDPAADDYHVEVAFDSSFSSLVYTETVRASQFSPELVHINGIFYWRIKASNPCGESSFSETRSFSPRYIEVEPAPHTHTASMDTDMTVSLGEPPDPGSVDGTSFTAYGAFQGAVSGSFDVSSNDIIFDPDSVFFPGELVETTITTDVVVGGDLLPIPYVWRFCTGVFTGHATFVYTQSFGSGDSRDVALGDLDGDDDLDAFVVNNGEPGQVWWNNGAGGFTDSGQSLNDPAGAVVVLGDVDGDGDLDALVVNGASPDQVWLNDGAGHFDAGQTLSHENAPNDSQDAALGDMDGDGDLDAILLYSKSTSQIATVEVWRNDGNGQFTQNWQSFSDFYPSKSIALDDLDGDGDLDVFVARHSGDAGAPNDVWLNDGTGNFKSSGQNLGNTHSVDVALGDLDSDGDLDALVVNDSAPNQVWWNDGQARFTDSGQSLGSGTGGSVTLGDLDGDGDLDAFLVDDSAIRVWLNDGAGHFEAGGTGCRLGNSFSNKAAPGDLDGDGDLDAFVASSNGQPETVWLNQPIESGIYYLPLVTKNGVVPNAVVETSIR